MTQRRGATRPADVPAEVRAALEAGEIETATLSEALAIDFATLVAAVAPDLAAAARDRIDPKAGVTRRMDAAAALIFEAEGPAAFDRLARHRSDTVRGWAAHILAATPDLTLEALLDGARPLADDPHFAVREWAWLALRPHIAADPHGAIAHLAPWVRAPEANLRRFAVEATRPRGVWSAHIPALKAAPEAGEPLLEPLKAETDRYVADSVANWINDAAKSRPDWARALAARWQAERPGRETARILKRGLRSLPPG